jgi:hypothetical protein
MPRPALPVPTWALLLAVVAVSFAFRVNWAVQDPAPWIFSDELHYWEPAKAIAYTGRPAIREVPGTGGFGILYPTLLAPAFMLFERLPDAYDAVKAINSLLMSLTVVPVYLLARRYAGRWLALAAGALSVAVPSLTYTGNVMVENAFYPLVAVWLLLLVRMLERPTVLRQLLVIAGLLAAMLTKVQAVTLVPALVTAIALVALLDGALRPRRIARSLVPYWPTAALLALAIPVTVVRQLLRDVPMREVLGAYAAVLDRDYPVNALADWAVWHLAALDIVLGFVPFAAFLLMLIYGLRPAAPRDLRILAAVGLGTVLWFVIVVSAFATTPTVERILERNFFHVVPLFFVAFVAWIARGAPRPWWAVAPAALFAGLLTLSLPLNSFLNATLIHSTPGLLPFWRWRDRAFSPESIDDLVAVAAIAAAVLFVLLPARWLAPVTIAALGVYYAAASRPVEAFTHRASLDAYNTIRSPRDWIDRAVGVKGDVSSFYWAGDQFRFWEAEIFNRSVGPVYSYPGPYDGLPGLVDVDVTRRGAVRGGDGKAVRARYVVTDLDTELQGDVAAAQDDAAMVLYDVSGPIVVRQRVDGLYTDRWSGGQALFTRLACRGGTVVAYMSSDPKAHRAPIAVTATTAGTAPQTVRVPPTTPRRLRTTLRPQDGICQVVYTMPASVPRLEYGVGDERALGVRFRFVYLPPG